MVQVKKNIKVLNVFCDELKLCDRPEPSSELSAAELAAVRSNALVRILNANLEHYIDITHIGQVSPLLVPVSIQMLTFSQYGLPSRQGFLTQCEALFL